MMTERRPRTNGPIIVTFPTLNIAPLQYIAVTGSNLLSTYRQCNHPDTDIDHGAST